MNVHAELATFGLATPRLYRDEHDIERIRRLLIAGRRADTTSAYIHSGDLLWWLYYQGHGYPWQQALYLWDDPANPDEILGWALLSYYHEAMEVSARPELCASGAVQAMYAWAEAEFVTRLTPEQTGTYDVAVSAQETALLAFLAAQGYQSREHSLNETRRTLLGELPPVTLPEGFTARHVTGQEEAEARATASHAAFVPHKEFATYLARYQAFMATPVYRREYDLVITARDGRVAAFCIVWPELETGFGLLEPVGVHPDFQGRGLGKAIVRYALHTLRAAGMNAAIVCYDSKNPAAKATYLGAGFEHYCQLVYMEKPIPPR